MPLTQDNLSVLVATPLGKDKLIVRNFSAEEGISSLFQINLEMVSTTNNLSFDSIVGKGVTIDITMKDTKKRTFNGLVRRFVQGGQDETYTTYTAEVVPWFWMLTLTRDSKIFQNKTVPKIIEAVFKDMGYSDFKNKLTKTYAEREYCVQYQESAFDFISRLMEDEGIFYFFEHETGKHTLIMGDDPSAHKPCPDLKSARLGRSQSGSTEEDILTGCTLEQNVATGKYSMDDFNFETSTTDLMVTASGKASKMRMYEYPGGFDKKDGGTKRANVRLEEHEWPVKLLHGHGNCKAFRPGYKFDLKEHDRKDMNATYILSHVVHSASQDRYSNSFQAFPKDTPFRPARRTPKPVIPGTQTAMVVGKKGEEIWTDKYGRVKVQFHWDQDGKKDENSSCWVRVASTWAGKSWGNIFIPRIGQEVVIGFEEGNPDRPLVTGSVYNAQTTAPYALPANQTQSGIKTKSSKKGGASDFNQIRFEDKKDSEEIFVQAQKDMTIEIKNDRTKKVLNDETNTIKNNRKTTIEEKDDTLEISKGNRKFTVKKGKEDYAVKGKRTLKIDDDEAHNNTKKFTHKVKKDYTLKVTGNITIEAGGKITIKSGKDFTADAGGKLTAKAKKDFTAKAGTKMLHEAKTDMTNKATKITNKASATMLNNAAKIDNKASGTMVNKAPMLTSDASGMHTAKAGGIMTVKGALVKIN